VMRVPSFPVIPAMATVETDITVLCGVERAMKRFDHLFHISEPYTSEGFLYTSLEAMSKSNKRLAGRMHSYLGGFEINVQKLIRTGSMGGISGDDDILYWTTRSASRS
jgi:hypothetical protein